MKQLVVILSLFAATSYAANGQGKLQIGIKKRVEDCTTKTRKGDLVHIHYTVSDDKERHECTRHPFFIKTTILFYSLLCLQGTLEDGTVFDSSIPREQPLTFTVGAGQVIKGWDQGLLGMCEGEKRRLVIPPELGYGSSGAGEKIPPDSILIFETELIKIERKDEL